MRSPHALDEHVEDAPLFALFDDILDGPHPRVFASTFISVSQRARACLELADMRTGFLRHHAGDWGECDSAAAAANDQALAARHRVVSVFRAKSGERYCVRTDFDPPHAKTLVLLPDEL